MPGDENYSDLKKFDWSVESITATSIKLKLDFENPEGISVDNVDTVKITFQNTSVILTPTSRSGKEAIPDGYVILVKIPP